MRGRREGRGSRAAKERILGESHDRGQSERVGLGACISELSTIMLSLPPPSSVPLPEAAHDGHSFG